MCLYTSILAKSIMDQREYVNLCILHINEHPRYLIMLVPGTHSVRTDAGAVYARDQRMLLVYIVVYSLYLYRYACTRRAASKHVLRQ
jgi:hypothetical protein